MGANSFKLKNVLKSNFVFLQRKQIKSYILYLNNVEYNRYFYKLFYKKAGTNGTSGTPLWLLGKRRSTIKIDGGTSGTINSRQTILSQ